MKKIYYMNKNNYIILLNYNMYGAGASKKARKSKLTDKKLVEKLYLKNH